MDRAAARQAMFGLTLTSASTSGPPSESTTPTPAEPAADAQTQDVEESSSAPVAVRETVPDRTDMLRLKPEVVGRFMQLMVPILIDVYAASVITTVRIKTLTGLLKAISFMEGDDAKRVLTVCLLLYFLQCML